MARAFDWGSMITLRTLGLLDLSAADRPAARSVLAQPKRFAVLVYLTVAAPGEYVRRDTLLALFWPDADQSRGRSVLRQTVYLLRQALGPEAIRSRGDEELGVDPTLVRCDVELFETLLASGSQAAALELYRGDFLTGFHAPDAAPELEEWMQSQTRRLRTLATNAAWSLACSEAERGNSKAAAHWTRQTLAFDPLDEGRARDAIRLLAQLGDRSEALHAYDEYSRRAERLGLAPSRAVDRLIESLRRGEDASPASISVEAPKATTTIAPAADAAASNVRVSATRRWKELGRRAKRWALPAMFTIALGAAVGHRLSQNSPHAVIAIGGFTDVAANPTEGRSKATAHLLSTSIGRLSGIDVIPPTRVADVQAQLRAAKRPTASALAAAKELGASYLVEGSVHTGDGGAVQVDLQMVDVRRGTIARVERARGTDLFSAIDGATTAIAAAFNVRGPTERITDVTTTSLVAYRLYDNALQAYYTDEDGPAAFRLFKAALNEDSSFAMAAYYASITATNEPERAELLARAMRLADRATDRERLLIKEGVAERTMSASATAVADTMAVRYPLDPDAQLALGNVLMRRGEFVDAARQYRRVITMDSLSLRRATRCLACDAFGRLIWAYLHADSLSAAERVAREYTGARPTASSFVALSMILVREGRFEEAIGALHTANDQHAGIDLEIPQAQMAIRDGAFASADARLERLMRDGATSVRRIAAWYLSMSLRTQGRFREALTIAEHQSQSIEPPIILLEMGAPRDAAVRFQSLASVVPPTAPLGQRARHQSWLLTHVATSLAASGDTARLSMLADSVERAGRLSAFGRDPRLHHYIRGLLWNARHEPALAAEEFRQAIWSWSEGFTRENYELARALIALRRPRDAVYPLQSALRGDLESSNLYVSRTDLHELLAQAFEQTGQRDSAAAHYRHVVNAWSRSDPVLSQRLAAARARLLMLSAVAAADSSSAK